MNYIGVFLSLLFLLDPVRCEHFDVEKMRRYVEQLYTYMHSKSVPPGDNMDARSILRTSVQVNDFNVRIINGIQTAEVNLNLYTTWLVTESKLINSEIDFGTLLLDKSLAWYPDLTFDNIRKVEELSPSRLELQFELEPAVSESNLNADSLPSVQPNGAFNDRRRKILAQDIPYYSFTQNLNVEVLCGGSRLVDQIGFVNCPLILKLGGNQAFLTELKWKENNECLYNERIKDTDLVHLSTSKKFFKSIKKYSTQQGLVINMCLSNGSKVFYFILVNIVQSSLCVLLLWIIPLGTMCSFLIQLALLFTNTLFFLLMSTSTNLYQLTNFLNNYTFYSSIICNTLITFLTVIAYYRASKILRKKFAQNNRKLIQSAYTSAGCTVNGQVQNGNTNDCILCTSTMNGRLNTNSGSTSGANNGLNYNSTYNHVSPMGLGSPSSRIMESRNSPGPLSLLQNGLISNKMDSNYNENYFLSGSSESGNGINGSSQGVQHNPSSHCNCIHSTYNNNVNFPQFSNEGSDLGSGSKLLKNSDSLKSVSAFNMISPNCYLITIRILLSIIYPLTLMIFWIIILTQSETQMECQGISTCKI